jgi:putative hydrolase
LETVDPDPSAIFKAVSRALEDMRKGQNPLDDGGLVGVFASPEQRAVLHRVQALMSLLEGHGNAVMTELGRRYVPGEERMARVLHQRRSVGGLTGLLYKLFGFEQKMKQYEVGERFINDVVAIGGYATFDNVWRSPDNLPTLDELTDARSWIQRVDRSRVAG